MVIMVTGGAGYVGSHTCIELIRAGYSVLIFDDFSNSSPEVVNRIERIAGMAPSVVRGDVRDLDQLAATLKSFRCEAVLHFAGLKSISASFEEPTRYYDYNVVGSLTLVKAMQMAGVRRLIFSSSATVYGEPLFLPLTETHPLVPSSVYGRTKMIAEKMLCDIASASSLGVAVLRYFNPVGAHDSGLIGEDSLGVSAGLMPALAQTAVGRRPHLAIFGNDYDTSDGTGVRDYVHVVDIATAHVLALRNIDANGQIVVNLSTGRGTSVLDLVRQFSAACGREIPYVFAERRNGDVATGYASADLARRLLGWRPARTVEDMCRDAWKWQSLNPDGYGRAHSG
jgi:UDP-glucose 4-epimerase